MRATLLALAALLAACSGGGGASGGGSGGDGCTPVKTPPDLVQNGSFDCGASTPDNWGARDGTLAFTTDAHGGGKAALLTVPATGQGTLLYKPDVATSLGSQTFCGTIWVKGTAPDVKLILRKVFNGSVEDRTFSSPVTQTWTRVPPNLVLDAPGGNATKLLLLVQTVTAKSGDTLLVDDADVWASATGDCKDAR
ncbi:MAG: hypothetical protein K1X89_23450 [Myxococcaceae bacterium]|nr:hypothetical protein [Myxococcaceae bacterium]